MTKQGKYKKSEVDKYLRVNEILCSHSQQIIILVDLFKNDKIELSDLHNIIKRNMFLIARKIDKILSKK